MRELAPFHVTWINWAGKGLFIKPNEAGRELLDNKITAKQLGEY